MAFALKIKGFENGELIPKQFTCDGRDLSPAIEWSDAPKGTQSFALIVDDPDAPGGLWTHWLLWDIPAHLHSLPEAVKPASVGTSGKNDFGRPGYGGPCPPKGHGAHRYFFTLYALDRSMLGIPAGSKRVEVEKGLKRRVIAQTQYIGRYGRE